MIPAYVALAGVLAYVVFSFLFHTPPVARTAIVGPHLEDRAETPPAQPTPYDPWTMRPYVPPATMPRPLATPLPTPRPLDDSLRSLTPPPTHTPAPKHHR